ncbi:MAG TPA: hotdog domain-containing protein [Candidatus Binatia bacterium]|nr:hotdog domain-containing protein [Candidatus Binatia bacterium]
MPTARTVVDSRRPLRDARPGMTIDAGRAASELVAAPYARSLGVSVADVGRGFVRLALEHRAGNANRNGTLHGGVIASLVHLAGAAVVRTETAVHGSETPQAGDPRLVDLSIHFLAAPVREALAAEARITRRGRAIVFADVALVAASGATVARGLVAARTGGAKAHVASAPVGRAVPRDGDGGIPAAAIARLAFARFSGSPFSARLGITSARVEGSGVVAALPWQDDLADHRGRVHEGALATLVDAAGGAAAWAVEGFDERGRAATIAMHLGFGASTRDEGVIALARAPWRTGEIFVIAVDLFGRASGRSLATGTVTYRIVRPAA